MSADPRAVCRAVGQTALVIAVAEGLEAHIGQVSTCLSTDGASRTACGWMFEPDALLPIALQIVSTLIAALGWWATLHHTRVRAWIARVCAVVFVSPALVWLLIIVSAGVDSASTGGGVLGWAIDLIAPVIPMVMLIASYRGRPALTLDEPESARWLAIMLAPLLSLVAGTHLAEGAVSLPRIDRLVSVLAGGLLYGVLRRRYPTRGCGHWLPTTLVLTALVVPSYTWLQWGPRLPDPGPDHDARHLIAWTLAVAAVLVLGVVQLLANRRAAAGSRAPVHAPRHEATPQEPGTTSETCPPATSTPKQPSARDEGDPP